GRHLNVLLGAGLALLPWLSSGAPGSAQGLALASGIAVLGLALPRGPVRERYGSWDRFVR
ncbi:MAG: vitamin K epoxide reductase family protein, partial [bacterium]